MARRAHCGTTADHGERGVVYLEFVIAFIPLFILFLGICQLTFVTVARLVVSHAATAAVRSAVVVLDDTADAYAGAAVGVLSGGVPTQPERASLLAWFGVNGTSTWNAGNSSDGLGTHHERRAQQGARMGPIRLAAEMPLMILAPSQGTMSKRSASLDRTLETTVGPQLGFAMAYTAAATAVTIHSDASSEDLAHEPVAPDAAVTARVTYLYYCSVPIVRRLMCSELATLLEDTSPRQAAATQRLLHFARPLALAGSPFEPALYTTLTSQATLPNQGSHATGTEGAQ